MLNLRRSVLLVIVTGSAIMVGALSLTLAKKSDRVFFTKFSSRWESRQFKLSFNFRFGNNGVKPARQRSGGAEDELKRTQQSGGMGIGNN